MEATRYQVQQLKVDGSPLETRYADVYVVVRDGEDGPGPSDWEAQAHGVDHRHIPAGRHHVELRIPGGSVLTGQAIVRFSDGTRHLFRGDGELHGLEG